MGLPYEVAYNTAAPTACLFKEDSSMSHAVAQEELLMLYRVDISIFKVCSCYSTLV